MIFSKAALIAVVVALSEQAQAFNVHRHLHNVVEQRAVKTDVVVVWETIYVNPGEEASSTVHHHKHKHTKVSPTHTTLIKAAKMEEAAALGPSEAVGMNGNVPVVGGPVSSSGGVVVGEDGVPHVGGAIGHSKPAPTTIQVTSTTQIVAPPAPTTTSTTSKAALPPPATTSSSVAPATTSQSSGGSTGGGSSGGLFSSKRGIAYNDPLLANLLGSTCKSCGWGYNWAPGSQGLDSSISYVPMLWGDSATFTDGWSSAAQDAISNGAKALMSFNEPDNASQSNMPPAQAAASHTKFMNPFAGQAKIGAPAITNSGSAGEGISWLKSFVKACETEGCHYDFCAVHWYSGAEYSETLFTLLDDVHKHCGGKPVWLTEFAPSGSDEDIQNFVQDVIPRLDALEYLDAYSYFMTSIGSLFSSSSVLSSFGQLYADL